MMSQEQLKPVENVGTTKTFADQIKDAEFQLWRIANKYGKDCNRFKQAASTLRRMRNEYVAIQRVQLESEVACG